MNRQRWAAMSRKVRDIVDGALFETADVDKFLDLIRKAGVEIVWKHELALLEAELADRDALLAKVMADHRRLDRNRNLEIFRMRCEGKDYQTIAGQFGLSASRVRNICHRIEFGLGKLEEAEQASLAERV